MIGGSDDEKIDRACFLIVVGPFFAAVAMFGASLAILSARLLFDIAANAGKLP